MRTGALALLLVGTLACCQAAWLPFRTTDGICHDLRIMRQDEGVKQKAPLDTAEALEAAVQTGTKLCKLFGDAWNYIRTVEYDPQNGNHEWQHICRLCDRTLNDAVLMWYGTATACRGSCPTGWRTLTDGMTGSYAQVDARYVIDPVWGAQWENSPDFGKRCVLASPGKVLCALQGRPASAQCSYTWRGTAPDCRDACEPGETLVAKDWYGDGARCVSGTYNKMLCERCQQEILDLNDCTTPTWFGTAPVCSGECYLGDRVMARAQSSSDVPSDQDPGGFGKPCWSGWKVRCQQCRVLGRSLLGSSNKRPTCTAPKEGRVWAGTPEIVLSAIKTYAACCSECRDAPNCRRFHVGPSGCTLFADGKAELKVVPAPGRGRGARAGGGVWQAGSLQAAP